MDQPGFAVGSFPFLHCASVYDKQDQALLPRKWQQSDMEEQLSQLYTGPQSRYSPSSYVEHSVSPVGLSQNLMMDGVNVWPGMFLLVAQLIYVCFLIIYRPSGDWGSLPLEGGIEAAYKRQLDAAQTGEEREKLMNDLLAKFEQVRNPIKTAHSFGIEEIIDPRDTRPIVCEVSPTT